MGYVGSYIWQLRQGVGDMRLLTPTVDTVCVNESGEILMVYTKVFDAWTFPGGYAEPGMSWGQTAARELLEESNLSVEPKDLIPFMTLSGGGYVAQYPDGTTQPFAISFVTKRFKQGNLRTNDEEEIADMKWLSVDQARKLPKSPSAIHILPAYEKWLTTGEFQQIVLE
ncbi:NUDIX domain-containing protein [Candidatus Saccharibacteria bacterium]|nr:NUDIX domain-containing protein [Candidatus Saccharibacteria bacterium]